MANPKKTPTNGPDADLNDSDAFDELEDAFGDEFEDAFSDEMPDLEAEFDEARHELGAAFAELRREFTQMNIDDARVRARTWVEENPTLAVFLAVGAGMLAGRLLSAAFAPKPPPPLPVRLRRRGEALARQAGRYASDLGETLADRAAVAGGVLTAQAVRTGDRVAAGAREAAVRAQRIGAEAAHRAADWGSALVDEAEDFYEDLPSHASRTARAARHTAEDAFETVQEKASHGFSFLDALLGTIKTAFAAVVVKKITDLVRGLR